MPKVGMPPLRRKALINAAISAIGDRGSLDVTMTEIANRAGVSSALAHHYFGAKDDLIQATMRHLLTDLGRDAVGALNAAETPRDRVTAIIRVNFAVGQFRPEVVHAWLAFYVEAQKSAPLRRLLRVYSRRLYSNLMSGLIDLVPRPEAERMAEAIAAMIDGLYIRRALRDGLPRPLTAAALVEDYVETKLRMLAAS
ncbi:transcriptional regulator BetI [Pseudaminobacter sp. 19-2017]|uniref:HTH-type transcriptional regulator BetI n=1 Tax=Pseudaminobacter soli (ex Zhang et al. 2022) TaxID=2831468 RepID=A0A942DWD3_9HYPH|nr:transcriptional regulator BetI [Pseudaminobacter soli]MBS3648193.1 transcriptional regulator BetI [Pseudaminobacter soli]